MTEAEKIKQQGWESAVTNRDGSVTTDFDRRTFGVPRYSLHHDVHVHLRYVMSCAFQGLRQAAPHDGSKIRGRDPDCLVT